jgi:hypothetical protein
MKSYVTSNVCRNTFCDDQHVITLGLQNEKSECFVTHVQTSKHGSWLWIHSIEIGTTKGNVFYGGKILSRELTANQFLLV